MKRENLEIERKLLIQFPSEEVLSQLPCVNVYQIEQTYVKAEIDWNRRVRKRFDGINTEFIQTSKHRINALTNVEIENSITESEYLSILEDRLDGFSTINKTRYVVAYKNHHLEIDIYPFWKRIATLEVELESIEETFELPSEIHVIRDVSGDKRFSNYSLAQKIPDEGEFTS